jgi:outer membrane biosynthesis protein TonB
MIQGSGQRLRLGALLSITAHLLILLTAAFIFRVPWNTEIVAAGEGKGGGQGGAIEVGIVEAKELGLTRPQPVSHLGETESESNNLLVETKPPKAESAAEALPTVSSKTPKLTEKKTETDRPTARQAEQLYSKQPLKGKSADTNVEVGRTFGSPSPMISAGVGIGSGGGSGGGTGGIPGGSEYGRRIQMILSRNYNPPSIADASAIHYVVVELRIGRDGRILSLNGGRLSPNYIKRSSPYDLVNRAAERAILASSPLPPFPAGFLASSNEAVAEIWFRYPK